ncbi:MAG: hypothetical protein QOI20_1657 [Acidimicrobiaceae bacterium]|jgi:hypothetical protein|nr:hypothetical protein [Acidimicrobiaceae bacterium]
MSLRPKWLSRPLLIVAVVALAVAALVVLDKMNIHDPTEGGTSAQIVNDTGITVRLAVCEDARCSHIAARGMTTPPGGSFQQSLIPHARVPMLVRPVGQGQLGAGECKMLVVGQTVQDRYPLTGLTPCEG